MMIQGFKTPSADFLEEMIHANVVKDSAPLDFSKIPRSVLEKIVHHSAMASLLGEDPPRVEISVGPDEDYHHMIKGISSITPAMANVFYQDGNNWYSLCLNGLGEMLELISLKLIDDSQDEWEVMGFDDDDEAKLVRDLSLDTLHYLGLLPRGMRSSL